jgi:hypothetical protein
VEAEGSKGANFRTVELKSWAAASFLQLNLSRLEDKQIFDA